ncbi:MAG TPA: dehydrogenase E1 component subunit alpha/beta [Flavobacteriales bacterium]|nr:dehydrogenase E1 component subunit alpha/beta [Flavobacteriales bacterium]
MFLETIEKKQLTFDRKKLTNAELIDIHEHLLRPRLIEEKMLSMLRQGRISKWFSGIGQEAVAVGSALAMQADEYILPMHRNLGTFTSRGVPMARLFSQFQGRANGFTKGRDRSFHFGTQEYKLVGMISHLGPQLGVADGIALAHKLRKEQKCTLVFTGDGATSEGDFHESVNTAAVWDLPVIIVIENNGYGLSTPSSEQFKARVLSDKALGYGMESRVVAGNNILEVVHALREVAESIRRRPRPVLVECMTFRMRGHEEASGTKYVPQELFTEWEKKDPVANYERWLVQEGILSEEAKEAMRKQIKAEIAEAVEVAFAEPAITPSVAVEVNDVYAKPIVPEPSRFGKLSVTPVGPEKRFIEAISEGMRESMRKFPELVLMGQDIAEYGGAFKVTDGFVAEFGKDRVRNTPLCESAILGAGLGLSINGMKAMVEMQFADFVSEGMTQICNNLAKAHWRWGQNADVVVRMPTGAGSGAGPFHSQSNESWFFKTPGLKVVYPAFPADAKGLLCAAFADPDPVIYFEHKNLYRSLNGPVPEGWYTLPIGEAALLREGTDLTLITYGMGVHWAIEALNELNGGSEGNVINADLIDLRSLLPWDKERVLESVRKTGKALVLHEDTLTGGIGGEIAAAISEECFEDLDAPVMRVASLDTPIPFDTGLEQQFLPKVRLREALRKLKAY